VIFYVDGLHIVHI